MVKPHSARESRSHVTRRLSLRYQYPHSSGDRGFAGHPAGAQLCGHASSNRSGANGSAQPVAGDGISSGPQIGSGSDAPFSLVLHTSDDQRVRGRRQIAPEHPAKASRGHHAGGRGVSVGKVQMRNRRRATPVFIGCKRSETELGGPTPTLPTLPGSAGDPRPALFALSCNTRTAAAARSREWAKAAPELLE